MYSFCSMLECPISAMNSSKEIFPSLSLSASMMVLSTICCSCTSVKFAPTIIFNTVKSSPFEMNPSPSTSYTRKANFNFLCGSPCTEKVESAVTNSRKSTVSSPSESNSAITRSMRGFVANSGICINSSIVIRPEASLSSLLKRLCRRLISSSLKLVRFSMAWISSGVSEEPFAPMLACTQPNQPKRREDGRKCEGEKGEDRSHCRDEVKRGVNLLNFS
mmetsp:Transcript_21178/g.55074  ORF Transcript_21178/g.55074 Transcript_21178/m.55074 type:complete len:219 (-) Transcript_21178:88-744(-)